MLRVHQLLSQITNINHPDIFGYTALHHASLRGHIKLAEALIKNGIDVNARSYRGTLACDVAALGGAADPNRHAIFNFLLQCGSHRPSFNGEQVNLGFSHNVDSWFGGAEDAWQKWSKQKDIQKLTLKMLVQFTSIGTIDQALEPSLWRGHESKLTDMLSHSDLPPYLMGHCLHTIPGLADLINRPNHHITHWSHEQRPLALQAQVC